MQLPECPLQVCASVPFLCLKVNLYPKKHPLVCLTNSLSWTFLKSQFKLLLLKVFIYFLSVALEQAFVEAPVDVCMPASC